MHSSFQDLSNIGIMPSSVRCLQTVSERAYVINFSHPKVCGIFFWKVISRPDKESVIVSIFDAPYELPDAAL